MDVDSSTRISNSQLAASNAEREASERISAARKRAQTAERETKSEMDRQAGINQNRMEIEMARSEGQVENQRLKGYEQVRDIKRSHEAESERYRRNAEKTLTQTKDHYKNTQGETESLGERAIREVESKNASQMEFQRKQGTHQIQALKDDQTLMKEQLHAERVANQEELTHVSQVERKNLEGKTRDSIQQSRDHYGDLYVSTVKNHNQSMANLSHETNNEIQNIRRDTAHRLDAYSSRQNDPFYKLVKLDAELQENDGAFVLTARIPEHEQGRIQINVRGSELIISGKRRNEETLETESGGKQQTSSYQSFNESFPLDWPVNPKLMTRTFDGDKMTVVLPKQLRSETPKRVRTVERAIAERPQFPPNLPNEKALARLAEADASVQEESAPVKPGKGYKTLT